MRHHETLPFLSVDFFPQVLLTMKFLVCFTDKLSRMVFGYHALLWKMRKNKSHKPQLTLLLFVRTIRCGILFIEKEHVQKPT